MEGTLRNGRLAAVVVLFLCAAPRLADAQQFVCRPILRGDTAVGLARQLTGDPARAYSDAFQIRDPLRRLFVPKSQYKRLSTDWQVCVVAARLKSTPVALAPDVAVPAAPAVAADESTVRLPDPEPTDQLPDRFAFVATIASAVSLMLLLYAAVGVTVAQRPMPPAMQRAGNRFVAAFERPLLDVSSSSPPIQVRLRFCRRKQRLEIAIAPGEGRRYPNLVDHKRNVEYDVNRVMRVLGNRFVVSDRLRASGKWVVVPIRLAGVK